MNRYLRFWPLQFLGWGGYAVILFTDMLQYPGNRGVPAFGIPFVVFGFLGSLAQRRVCRRIPPETSWPRALLMVGLGAVFLGIPGGIGTRIAQVVLSGRPHDWSILRAAGGTSISQTVFLLAWSGLYLSVKHIEALQAATERAARAEALAREAQLQTLRYQLNPHFLFNTLNALGALVAEGDTQAANRMLVQLSVFLRSTLYGLDRQQVSLNEEVALTGQYLAIEQARLGPRLQLDVCVSAEAANALVPPLFLQPLAENAVRHGIDPRPEGGQITIQGLLSGTRVRIIVSDDGVGSDARAPTRERARGGIGLANTIERLRVFYGSEQRVTVRWPDGGGCRIELEVPYLTSVSPVMKGSED